jgi:hypothetical protein
MRHDLGAASLALLVAVLLGAAALAQTTPPEGPPAQAPAKRLDNPRNRASPSPESRVNPQAAAVPVIGLAVESSDHHNAGAVTDIIASPQGRALRAVVNVGAVAGIGGKLVPLDWSELRVDEMGRVVRVPMTVAQLAKAPAYRTIAPNGSSASAPDAENFPVVGLSGRSADNKPLGPVSNAAVSPQGRIETLALSVGGKEIAVDWSKVHVDPVKRVAYVAMTERQLEKQPAFEAGAPQPGTSAPAVPPS